MQTWKPQNLKSWKPEKQVGIAQLGIIIVFACTLAESGKACCPQRGQIAKSCQWEVHVQPSKQLHIFAIFVDVKWYGFQVFKLLGFQVFRFSGWHAGFQVFRLSGCHRVSDDQILKFYNFPGHGCTYWSNDVLPKCQIYIYIYINIYLYIHTYVYMGPQSAR